jgi:hypothetical protein
MSHKRNIRLSSIFFLILFAVSGWYFFDAGLPTLALIASALAVIMLVKVRFFLIKLLLNLLLFGGGLFLILVALSLVLEPSEQNTDELLVITDDNHLPDESSWLLNENGETWAVHYRKWNDHRRRTYHGHLRMQQNLYRQSRRERVNLQVNYQNNYKEYWQKVYQQLSSMDAERMPAVYDFFDSVRHEHQLDNYQFADMLVSCIQHIPYIWIHDNDCQTLDAKGDSYRQMHEQFSCMPNVKYSLQTPAEFMYNLKGDCDTRAVMLYQVMRHFGYDVAVLISEYYGHAVLGINMPARGDYVEHRGKKYYAWETTNTGYPVGEMAPSFGNMKYWEVVLAP